MAHITRFRDRTDRRLFDRLSRGVRLNAAGKLFLTDARRILRDADEAKIRAERIAHGKAGTLRIGLAALSRLLRQIGRHLAIRRTPALFRLVG